MIAGSKENTECDQYWATAPLLLRLWDAALSSILAMAVCWDDAGSPIEMPFVENEVAAAPWPASTSSTR